MGGDLSSHNDMVRFVARFYLGSRLREALRVRDPERIGRILEAFEEVWSRNPDLRFGQMMVNLQGFMLRPASSDPWFIEDDEWEDAINYIRENGFRRRTNGEGG